MEVMTNWMRRTGNKNQYENQSAIQPRPTRPSRNDHHKYRIT